MTVPNFNVLRSILRVTTKAMERALTERTQNEIQKKPLNIIPSECWKLNENAFARMKFNSIKRKMIFLLIFYRDYLFNTF